MSMSITGTTPSSFIPRQIEEPRDPLDIARSLGDQGLSLYQSGDFGKAIEKYEDAVATLRKIGGDDALPNIAKYLKMQGCLLCKLGDFRGAIEKYKGAVAILREIDGDKSHSDIALCLGIVANLSRKLGDYKGASWVETKRLPILEMLEGIHGRDSDHSNVKQCKKNLASSFRRLSEPKKNLHFLGKFGDFGKVTKIYHCRGNLAPSSRGFGRSFITSRFLVQIGALVVIPRESIKAKEGEVSDLIQKVHDRAETILQNAKEPAAYEREDT